MLVDIAKALADESRLRIILALDSGELCVCQLTELLGLATSTVSKHISILRHAGLVIGYKRGRWVFYCLNRQPEPTEVSSAIEWVLGSRSALPSAAADRKRLKAILKQDPEELCRLQSAR